MCANRYLPDSQWLAIRSHPREARARKRIREERKTNRQSIQGTSPRSIVQATWGRNAYLEFRSHAVWVARDRERKKRGEEKRREETKQGSSRGADAARDYKEEPLNRGPGPLQGTEVLPSWLTQRRGVSRQSWPPTPPHAVTHGPSWSITSGRGTRLQRFSVHFPSALPHIRVISRRWPFSAQSVYTQGSRTIARASRERTRAVCPLSINRQMWLAWLRDATCA